MPSPSCWLIRERCAYGSSKPPGITGPPRAAEIEDPSEAAAIHALDWVLIVHQTQKEAYAPVSRAVLTSLLIIGVLILVIPLSTWFFQLTGKIYMGAFLNAALVAWMFTSSQVIAPIPV